jgi:hypothetical protein
LSFEEKPVEVIMQDVALTGTVYDTGGNPVGGVLVATGSLSATTDGDGKFTFEKAGTVNSRVVIRFTKSGYYPLTRSGLKEDEMAIHAVLKQKGNTDASVQTSFNAVEANTLSVGGMKAQIPASALVKADGSLYRGSVNADMLYLDPNAGDFAEAMPGGDLAAIRSDNRETQLLSYGMIKITLTDNAGNPLQLQDGANSELTFPIPSGMGNTPPATIPLWSFDEERGIWVEEGNSAGALFGGFIYDEVVLSHLSGYTALPNETIAGKSCKVFSYTDTDCRHKIGAWNGLLMLVETCEGVSMVATGVSLDVPANAFTKTMEIF